MTINRLMCVALGAFCAMRAFAQSASNLTLTLTQTTSEEVTAFSWVLSQSGLVTGLGNATLVFASSSQITDASGDVGPVQIQAALVFNEIDSIRLTFSQNDPNFGVAQTVTTSGGRVAGGTGAYDQASGTLDLSIVKDNNAPYSTATTSGSGMLTVGSQTTPITFTGFRGVCCVAPELGRSGVSQGFNAFGTLNGVSQGQGTATFSLYGTPPAQTSGTAVVSFSSSLSGLNLWFSYAANAGGGPPSTFNGDVVFGINRFLNATGPLMFTSNSSGTTLQATGSISTGELAPVITGVQTAFGGPQIAYNTWLQINGTNLVPANTPAGGVDWSNAPEFSIGQMPTQLGPISVTVDGLPAFIYWYCSAQTDSSCTAGDQINVLAPLIDQVDPGVSLVVVTNSGVSSVPAAASRSAQSPAFFAFDAAGHVVARHLDSSLVGPASLYPGLTTPAAVGETIAVVGSGFGGPANSTIVSGSSTQTGDLSSDLSCWISGVAANVVCALVSPGLYQFNIVIPSGVPSGDNPVNCVYEKYATFPGALIAVQ